MYYNKKDAIDFNAFNLIPKSKFLLFLGQKGQVRFVLLQQESLN